MTILEIASIVLMVVGAAFCLFAAIGIVRMPDVFTRMQAATKAGTLGVGCLFLAVAFHFAEPDTAVKSIAVVLFLFLTAPVASHLIGRSAYAVRSPIWKGTVVDELEGKYDQETHRLKDDAADHAADKGERRPALPRKG